MNELPQIIGLAGTFASGKDTLAKFLSDKHGYTHASTGDMVRLTAQERYGNIERPTLQKTAVELRSEGGPGILAKRALKLPHPIVISGIRTAGEAQVIKEAGGVMIFVDAKPSIRYQRMRGRSRDGESELSFEEFMAREKREIDEAKTEFDQNIAAVRELSTIILDNSGGPRKFLEKAEKSLAHYVSYQNRRPES